MTDKFRTALYRVSEERTRWMSSFSPQIERKKINLFDVVPEQQGIEMELQKENLR